MATANPVRGEATVTVGKVEIILAATMESLAQLSGAIGCQSLQDLYARLAGAELAATRAAIPLFVQSGKRGGEKLGRKAAGEAALAEMNLSDTAALQAGFITILAAMTREPGEGEGPDAKNGEGVRDR